VDTATGTSATHSRQKSLQTGVESMRLSDRLSATLHNTVRSGLWTGAHDTANPIEQLMAGGPSFLVCHGSPNQYDVEGRVPKMSAMTKGRLKSLRCAIPRHFVVRSTAFAYREHYHRDEYEILLSRWRSVAYPSAVTQAGNCTSRPATRTVSRSI
jgi:hypothetical protein